MSYSLKVSQAYATTDPALFSDPSTKSLPPLDEIVGQARAQQAVHFAMSMPGKGYNIYAVGHNGLGKRTMVMRYLKSHPVANGHTFDWVYVADFDDGRYAKKIAFPPGNGAQFKKDIEAIINKLLTALPLAFDNDLYYSRAEKIKTQLTTKQEHALNKITEEAKKHGVSLSLTTQGDYQFVAMNGEDAHTEETFAELPDAEQQAVEDAINSLEKKLRGISRLMNEWEEKFVDQQQKLETEIATSVMAHHFEAIQESYGDIPEVLEYIDALQADVIENLDMFLDDKESHTDIAYAITGKKLPRRYQVNALVTHKDNCLPIVVEESPSYHSLFGYAETATFKGTVVTDFTLLRGGSMHRANGGVLMMDAVKVLERPYVWDGLKKALRSQQLDMSSLEREVTLSGSLSLEPQPIPLNVKIILFGDRHTYRLLQQYDPEFVELFRVTADFEEEMPRTPEGEMNYAKFISSIVNENGLNHCDRNALCRVIEFSARQADDQFKLSLHSAEIANLLREAHYWSVQSESTLIRAKHIEQALDSQEQRMSRARDQMLLSFEEGATRIDLQGDKVGQINALTVLSTGEYAFGLPSRLSATCAIGKGEVIAIERIIKLSGAIHDKGVMILTAFLESLFAKQAALPIKATLTFEQSYGVIDGDSASMAELIALLSAIAEIPIKQNMAITGSMDQFGQSQAIGGVNEKLEGFFDVSQRLHPKQSVGVVVPTCNARHLMLKKSVLTAMEKGRFEVIAVDSVFEAIEAMTGLSWEGKDGIFDKVMNALSHYQKETKKSSEAE
ncbi:Lon protease family protein [Thaumasiovibrio subtropicus]|uniref:Lon protease family protein n=1 Tax=Thaumasiovibrio subtropicus TaxID=1891207 RepID=UPI000B35DE90|nr:ATP-binding protein [Thaumasiovibrio subtropicus]